MASQIVERRVVQCFAWRRVRKVGIKTQGRFTLEEYYMKGKRISSNGIVYIAGQQLITEQVLLDNRQRQLREYRELSPVSELCFRYSRQDAQAYRKLFLREYRKQSSESSCNFRSEQSTKVSRALDALGESRSKVQHLAYQVGYAHMVGHTLPGYLIRHSSNCHYTPFRGGT